MPTLDLKSQIQSLGQLQVVDSEIAGLRQEKEAKPQEIMVLEAGFEAEKKQVTDAENLSLELQKQKKEEELELATKEEGIKKFQTQLYQLKTNKEYQAMVKEIEGIKADASLMEDKILELMDKIDAAKANIEKEKQKLQEKEKEFNAQKNKIQARIKEIDERLTQLETQRSQIIPEVEPKIFSTYEKILANRNSLAIVEVKNNSCGGCNMYVPPQVINLIKMYERIIVCEVCNRILYIEGE